MVATRKSSRIAAKPQPPSAPVPAAKANKDAKPKVVKGAKAVAKAEAAEKHTEKSDVGAVKKEAKKETKAEKVVAKEAKAGDVVITIEHCKSCQVYRRKAAAIADAIRAAYPDKNVTFAINETKPRSKSFEVTLKTQLSNELLWSGIKMGPPRKLKFPEPDVIVTKLGGLVK